MNQIKESFPNGKNLITNRFGEGILYNKDHFTKDDKIYAVCTACMSVWSDLLSYGNKYHNIQNHSSNDMTAIIILGCQVTDLAVYNDLRTAEQLHA